jgi:glutaconate CoA-transferase subunit B
VLVERCDYVSAVGYGDGSSGFRESHGLDPQGPASIITPLCVFEFDPDARSARLRSLHPGVTIEEVREQTGFDIGDDGDVPVTPVPTEEQLELLRTRIDVRGSLR